MGALNLKADARAGYYREPIRLLKPKAKILNPSDSFPPDPLPAPRIIPRSEHTISRAGISPNALRVLYRLRDGGFQAFLVGGCVRDLLLGIQPKDFDVATDALPEQVKKLFRNCRLVGRRFRLAHVFFGREIIEVATFRAASAPAEADEPAVDADAEDAESAELNPPIEAVLAALDDDIDDDADSDGDDGDIDDSDADADDDVDPDSPSEPTADSEPEPNFRARSAANSDASPLASSHYASTSDADSQVGGPEVDAAAYAESTPDSDSYAAGRTEDDANAQAGVDPAEDELGPDDDDNLAESWVSVDANGRTKSEAAAAASAAADAESSAMQSESGSGSAPTDEFSSSGSNTTRARSSQGPRSRRDGRRRDVQEEDADSERMFDETGRIIRDNVYGNIDQDVWRRDFTVNALYYNIADFSLWDYTGGAEDVASRTLRLIGDPETRFREDPVRMLRAARFEAKLDFHIDAATAEPIEELRDLLGGVPPARLFDETLKIFLGGYGEKSFLVLRERGLLAALLPTVDDYLEANPGSLVEQLLIQGLRNTDARVLADKPVTPTFLFALLLYGPIAKAIESSPPERWHELSTILDACDKAVRDAQEHISIPRRFSLGLREMFALQPRLEYPRGRRALRVLEHPRFRAAYDLLLLRSEFGLAPKELVDWWTRIQTVSNEERGRMADAITGQQQRSEGGGGARRSGGRRRRRRGRRPGSPS